MSNYQSYDLLEMFRALSDPTRLAIYQFLRCCSGKVSLEEDGSVRPAAGPTVGEVCCQVQVAQSTVSHHLKELRRAGLIKASKVGRAIHCEIDGGALSAIREFATGRGPLANDKEKKEPQIHE
jgi:ArsR family transcriptional regulator